MQGSSPSRNGGEDRSAFAKANVSGLKNRLRLSIDCTMETTLMKARRLRRKMTPPERKVWQVLRGRGLCGVKFRRQVPIGPFIVDFLCVEAGLIVEIDGDSHSRQIAYDRRRTMYLEEQGYRVIRLANREVLDNLEGAMKMVAQHLSRHRHC